MDAPRISPTLPSLSELSPVLADLGIELHELHRLGDGRRGHKLAAADGAPEGGFDQGLVHRELAPEGTLLLFVPGPPPLEALARWRNALWPLLHAPAWYRFNSRQVERVTLQGDERVGESALCGALIVARRREHLMSPASMVRKFDDNAQGWDGQPGGPGYPHFRWMRRYVGLFAPAKPAARILDFGCGAGWCGIEAALRSPGASLCSFDPSSEMIAIAEANARRAGVQDFTGRTGFGESPPFPEAGEEPFDLVISSGVVSFSPDVVRWLDGLAGTVRPGGDVVIGDIHRDSRGFRRRRLTHPVLPAREMNAQTRDEVRAGLASRGFTHQRSAGYQLTWPVPQLMHLNETRFKGALTYPLLWSNQLAASLDRLLGSPMQDQFDSWVMHLRRPGS